MSAMRPGNPPPPAVLFLLGVILVASGCSKPPPPKKEASVNPKVHIYRMQRRSLTATVSQPAFVYPYEQTSIFPKVNGFVDKWNVDIGDRLKKGQELAHIYVPELVEELAEAKAQEAFDRSQVESSRKAAEAAANNKKVAEAQAKAAEEEVKKAQAGVERWQLEVARLNKITDIVNAQILQESQRQLQVDIASRNAASANAEAAKVAVAARQSDLEKAHADVASANAKVLVSAAHVRKLEAMVSYTHITAPYDCAVIDRNANLGDYVEIGKGDFSAGRGASNQSAGQGTPLYVIASTDRVRVYVDVPEMQAAFVGVGTPVRLYLEAARGEEIEGKVVRTSWSLQFRTRTLRAEVDLPNPRASLAPGMYAHVHMNLDCKDAWAVPLSAATEIGEQKCIYVLQNNKAIKTPVQAGVDDGKYIELFHKQVNGRWVNFDGSEQVILGDLGELTSGREVEVEK